MKGPALKRPVERGSLGAQAPGSQAISSRPTRQHNFQQQSCQHRSVRAHIYYPETEKKRPQVTPSVAVGKGDERMGLMDYFMRNRIIFIDRFLDDQAANRAAGAIFAMSATDPSQDIRIYVSAQGGSPYALFALLDTMRTCEADIQTVAFGMVTGVASLVVACGTKGKRFAMRNARIQFDQLTAGLSGSAYQNQTTAAEIHHNHLVMVEYLREATGLPRSKLEDMLYRSWWTGGQEAVDFGFIDGIIEDANNKPQPTHPPIPDRRPAHQYLFDYTRRDGKMVPKEQLPKWELPTW